MSETSFLNVYKLFSDAPDPYPLLDAAVDQTVKVAEARMLESELNRLREENGELKKQVGEMGREEDKRKKAETKAEQLEEKVGEVGLSGRSGFGSYFGSGVGLGRRPSARRTVKSASR
jgi:homeobox protein cut-like